MPTYDERWKTYVERSHRALIDRISLAGVKTALDIGCGTGSLELGLTRDFPELQITGVDPSPEMIETAKQKSGSFPQVVFILADAHELPFADESFDLIVTASSFHYFVDPRRALKEVKRVLSPWGKFWLMDWCHDFFSMQLLDWLLFFRGKDYRRCYRQSEIRAFLEGEGFEVIRSERFKISPLWGFAVFESAKDEHFGDYPND